VSAFWDTWRKEIIRGAALFCAVLAIGLFVNYAVGRGRQIVVTSIPAALRDLRSEFGADPGGGPRSTGGTWTYKAKLAPKQRLSVRNTRGSITVGSTSGDTVQITAVKTYRSSDTGSVRVVAVPYDGGIAVCALWEGDDACGPGESDWNFRERRHGESDLKWRGRRHNDVAVDFTVRLPRNVGLRAATFVGDVHVSGAHAPLDVRTVSGDVDAVTARGPATAESKNGNVRIRVETFGETGDVSASTLNGSVTAELPAQLDADVSAKTVNGSIASDYPLTVSGKFMGHDAVGTVGRGGRRVRLETVNGSIRLKKAV